MMKRITSVIASIAFAVAGQVYAGGNAAPLGLELGLATIADVQKEVGDKSKLSDRGLNRYSGGKMLSGSGAGLGIDGLSGITFIFDQSDILAGVLMTLPKGEGMSDMQNGFFKKTVKALASKYKLLEKREPFVGDAYARFGQGNSVIELDAPHMGFSMDLRYVTKELMAQVVKQNAVDRAAKDQARAGRL